MSLKEKLIKDNKIRWLDIGCAEIFEAGFYYLDILPEDTIDSKFRSRYFRVNILNSSKKELEKLDKFDFLRMQHVFEHFSPEEGQRVLRNCAKILKKDGIILITTPDLKIHIQTYLKDRYKQWRGFKEWATERISEDAPNSFYFSMFAHSMSYEENQSHKWCYDFEGLKYQLEVSGKYKNIKELSVNNPLASIPFTHNRPEEDVCVIAEKI